jgi:membrane protein DedA with SNARE-associated domain
MTHSDIVNAIQFVERHGYALLFFWILAEQGALPIPSVPLLIAVGTLIKIGHMSLLAAIASAVAGALISDSVWFYFGRRRGKRVLRFICRVSLEPDSCVKQTENTFLKYGLNTLLVSKFIPGLNAVAAPLAGDSGVAVHRFLAIDTAGIVIWSAAYMGLGYLFSGELERAIAYAQRLGSGFFVLAIGLLAAWIVWKYVQRKRFLKQIEVARISPEELRDRMTAGEDLYILDLRSRREDDTIPGAVRITIEDLIADSKHIPRDRDIILFCS